MPPEDETQPTAAERAVMIAHLTGQLKTARDELSDAAGGRSVLRRLNSWEYRQTIGELFGLNVAVWNPAEDFPEEVKVHGFDNNSAELVTSGRLMDHYFIAAEEAIRRSTQFGPGQSHGNTCSSRHFTLRARKVRSCRSSFRSTASGIFPTRRTRIS